jgi:hypothetical protein
MASVEELLERENRLVFEQSKLREDMKFYSDVEEQHKVIPTRFEVIDKTGRIYVNNNCEFELSWQDEGRTLKVFIK